MSSPKYTYHELEQKYQETRAILRAILNGEIDLVIGKRGALLLRLQSIEESLQASEKRYRTLIENALEGVLVLQDDKIVYANPTIQQLTGFSSNELLSLSQEDIRDHIHPEDRERMTNLLKIKVKHAEKPTRELIRLIHKSGKMIWVYASASMIEYNKRKALMIFFMDATEQKVKEQALEESLEQYKRLTQTATDAIVGMDEKGKISFWNKAAEEIFGYSESEAIGAEIHELLIPSEYREQMKEAIDRFIQNGMGDSLRKTSECKGMKKDGTIFPVELSIAALKKGDKWTATGIIRDISEKKKLQEQFFQAQKMEAIGKLAGGIAHDFNNILTVINGYTNLLKAEINPKDPLYNDLEEIRKAGERAAQLTRQLLAFSRKQMLEVTILNLNELITNLDKMLCRLIGEDIQLNIHTDENLLPVKADRGQLEQVLINLAVNARDAMPDGGTLTIETKNVMFDAEYLEKHKGIDLKMGNYSMIAVTDNGIGMDKKTEEQIFEPFFTTKKRGQGTGLGLATVYGIIKQSNGFIWVYSEKNLGTTFKIYLPSLQGVVKAQKEPIERSQKLTGNETILVVEDEDSVRELACRVLRRYGYNVLEAQNGGEALLLCEGCQEPIDLILTDVVMPRMSGKAFVKRLERIKQVKHVIYMSGYTDNVVVHHGMIDPGIHFIQKPISPETLLRNVRRVLDQRANQRE